MTPASIQLHRAASVGLYMHACMSHMKLSNTLMNVYEHVCFVYVHIIYGPVNISKAHLKYAHARLCMCLGAQYFMCFMSHKAH